ncbi:hypothetical protein AVEN_48264-1 [Araneus ventricosus]|uniref:Uncharacterized protein n=1 Tax=Araneus ventricosus TaxID=182803 RepID=A0A4Y2EKM8_ARAVE|nr:hypothetical protein AVEN_48264-1 [Araneus ventricosus]
MSVFQTKVSRNKRCPCICFDVRQTTLRLACEKHRRCEQQTHLSQQRRDAGHQTLRFRWQRTNANGPENEACFEKMVPKKANPTYTTPVRPGRDYTMPLSPAGLSSRE